MPDSASSTLPRRRPRLVDVLVLSVSAAWFVYNVNLPDAYNGRLCCDSVDYIGMSGRKAWLIVSDCAHHALGYPLFLRAHLLLHHGLGLPASPDWLTVALGTAFVVFVASTYALVAALRFRGLPVPRLALLLVLAHPGLAAHAASPLTDSLALSLLMLLTASVLRFDWVAGRRAFLWSAVIGLLLGSIVQVRTTHYVAAVTFLAAFALSSLVVALRRRTVAILLLPLVTLVTFERLTAPRREACLKRTKEYRFLGSQDTEQNIRNGILASGIGPRSYAYIVPTGPKRVYAKAIVVPDAFTEEHFGCFPAQGPILSGVLACYQERAPYLPLYFGKKLVALLDHAHLNPHAATITTPPVRWWNRIFSMLTFAGFPCLVVLTTWAALRRRLPLQVFLPIVYLAAYVGASLIPHTEARYGIPLVPFCLIALVLALQVRGARRWALVAMVVAACTAFIVQTTEWDNDDPAVFGTPLELPKEMVGPPGPPPPPKIIPRPPVAPIERSRPPFWTIPPRP